MEQKYILILGAGLMQRPSIEAAKELGFKTVVVDGNPKAICVSFADFFEPIDLKDAPKIVEYAKTFGNKLAGVFTAGTDFSAVVSYVAKQCGFVAHDVQAAINATNKIQMRSCFKKENVPSPDFQEINRSQITSFLSSEAYNSISYPKVVKPVDNMGARGCRMIRSKSELLKSIEDAVHYSRTGNAILEDYMEGPEFSIDAIVYNGTLTITGFADRHIFYPPYFIEMGHTMPTVISEKEKNELILCFAQGIKSLGLTCGEAKADIKYTDKGPMIGEIAARLSGGYMSGWTFPYSSDFNLTKQALLIAAGQIPEELLQRRRPLPIKNAPFAVYEIPSLKVSAERAWISIPGKVKSVYGLEKAAAVPFIKNVLPRVNYGDKVDFPRNNVEKCGNVISLSPDHDLSVEASENAVASIVLRLESHNEDTEKFLEGFSEKYEQDAFPPDAFSLNEQEKKEYCSSLNTAGKLGADSSAYDAYHLYINAEHRNFKDFNHRSFCQTLKMFDEICPKHAEIDGKVFLTALLRGGLQGILYVADNKKADYRKKRR